MSAFQAAYATIRITITRREGGSSAGDENGRRAAFEQREQSA